ncbi:PH (Pleckstrin Homology) domain-containing protein [Orenia metallireducens]|jgi:hypothetical protein|uniref:PH domain-containing protein n=1 Tax=Orenia metallireducens TaxID=1413210 RepID=A0A285HH46_9FIRM|nr:PH domain-containing protein [Orenia metallireducens]PRX27151.1 PH (Pleckstrin Homology) domain-containing protein [Orenia metallireducens]SNY34964.1 PH domain-containing protein [Orenia metallireducens]
MGFLDGLMGNATEMNAKEVEQELTEVLLTGENVNKGYKVLRDFFVFTDKRLIIVDKQGITGKKIEYHSIPYSSIRHFSVETAGSFDADSELKLWVAGASMPIQKQFGKSNNILEVQKTLAEYVL